MAQNFELSDEEFKNPQAIRDKLINYIGLEHRDWYDKYAKLYIVMWNLLNVVIVAFSAAASIIAALSDNVGDPSHDIKKYALIFLPAFAALSTTLLVQFRVRDNLRLREEGRIEVESIICEAYKIDQINPDIALSQAMDIKKKIHELERKQLLGFSGDNIIDKNAKTS